MVSFENFVKSMTPTLSESKVTPSFCFPLIIPDDPTATNVCIPCDSGTILPCLSRTTFDWYSEQTGI